MGYSTYYSAFRQLSSYGNPDNPAVISPYGWQIYFRSLKTAYSQFSNNAIVLQDIGHTVLESEPMYAHFHALMQKRNSNGIDINIQSIQLDKNIHPMHKSTIINGFLDSIVDSFEKGYVIEPQTLRHVGTMMVAQNGERPELRILEIK